VTLWKGTEIYFEYIWKLMWRDNDFSLRVMRPEFSKQTNSRRKVIFIVGPVRGSNEQFEKESPRCPGIRKQTNQIEAQIFQL
jgi:hypothetical protein